MGRRGNGPGACSRSLCTGGVDARTSALGYFITPCVGTLLSILCYLSLPHLVSGSLQSTSPTARAGAPGTPREAEGTCVHPEPPRSHPLWGVGALASKPVGCKETWA